ncbi:hypothetical protein AMJ40_00610 [candidate division TA06 bacterium DG_26]|uniref:Uncharacterized protein n=1 Tax=candidate division TA06 bacterium DG_26 TaxID=1703771 RepID=A0A0S7WMW4_UNCT6|nr:MAG: hypothetical protein AMJ40_00610 [candidate division TA06 bacterium DG_26]
MPADYVNLTFCEPQKCFSTNHFVTPSIEPSPEDTSAHAISYNFVELRDKFVELWIKNCGEAGSVQRAQPLLACLAKNGEALTRRALPYIELHDAVSILIVYVHK